MTAAIPPSPGARLRILVVEDNADNRDMLVRRLTRQGHDVLAANDGLEAVRAAPALIPDLILMDLSMPVMSGLDAAARLAADPATRRIPIIALTANALDSVRRQCLDAGFAAFATKPLDFTDLLSTIETVMAGRSLDPQHGAAA